MKNDITDKKQQPDDQQLDRALRPQCLEDFVGQPDLIQRLKTMAHAAKERQEPPDHILLAGPPGLGKSSIGNLIASEVETEMITVNAPSIGNIADLMGILCNIQTNSVLFIDEIHRLNIKLEEFLHTAMEDFKIEVKKGGQKKPITTPLSPFCLVGATTMAGKISGPMLDRFGLVHTISPYKTEDLKTIILANAKKLEMNLTEDSAAFNLASRCRGTPRIANRLLRRVRDYAQLHNNNKVTNDVVQEAMKLEGVDRFGLTTLDRKYLTILNEEYAGGPVGVEALSATLQEARKTLEEYVEPFLMSQGLVTRMKTGRSLTSDGITIATGIAKNANYTLETMEKESK